MNKSFMALLTLIAALVHTPAFSQDVNLLGIDHVALQVADLAVSAKWYKDRFGFQILHTWKDVWMIGKGNMKIGLFLRAKAMPVDDSDNRKIIQHFAFSIDGDKFQAAVDKFKSDGVNVTEVEDTGIAYSVFLKDPDGFDVEVTTYYGPKPTPPKK